MAQTGKLERLWIDAQEQMLARLERLGGRRRRASAIAPHLVTGVRGERAALFELRRRGIIVVARRWTSPKMRGDIDLIGWDGDCLCFIEVKTRTARDFRPAELAVDDAKRDMIRGLARAYLRSLPKQSGILVRFDVISVYVMLGKTEFEFFEGAFGWR